MGNVEIPVNGGTGYRQPIVQRAVISTYQIYEVKDSELEILKEGKDGGVYLNVAISLFSISVSLMTSMFISPIEESKKWTLIAIIVFMAIMGIIFYIFSRKVKTKVEKTYNEILSRKQLECCPPEEVAKNIQTKPNDSFMFE